MAKKKEPKLPSFMSDTQASNVVRAVIDLIPDHSFEILGRLPSKKNNYVPNGRSFFKPQRIKNSEKMFDLQVPPELRNKGLEHPHIMLEVQMPKKSWRSDRDNGYTFLQDGIKNAGIIPDDSTNRFNGVIVMLPVVESDEYRCKIRIWENPLAKSN